MSCYLLTLTVCGILYCEPVLLPEVVSPLLVTVRPNESMSSFILAIKFPALSPSQTCWCVGVRTVGPRICARVPLVGGS